LVYLPPLFTETRDDVLIAHIERHDFGLLVSQGEPAADQPQAEMIASQIPFLVARRGERLLLQSHIARANPQAADLDRGSAVLAIFAGPHAYISPGWYEAGPAVPTWNYASVHAYGTAHAIRDPDWLRDMVERLSARHEAREAVPWRMRDLPPSYLESMLRGIVGIEIVVSRLEGKFKLSQNRPAADRPRIIAALERREDEGSREVAALMRQRDNPGEPAAE
jgi:transcriptional regulator